jgi:two-component system, NtrC family, response regulator HydG
MSTQGNARNKPAVLLIDGDLQYGRALTERLGGDYALEFNPDIHGALTDIEAGQFDVVLLNIDGDAGESGFELLKRIRKRDASLPIFALTGQERVDTALRAGQLGATDYLSKSTSAKQLGHRIDAVLRRRATEKERNALRRNRREVRSHFVGGSDVVQRLLADAEIVASVDSTVLITGENGTGKEVLARFIHERSRRADKLFVAVSCAAIPDGLVESKLFGHERGAFTGAVATCKGSFELADQGTLFLDEITEMPVALQPKLLRALQSGEFSRVGSEHVKTADARVICSSNRDMAKTVEEGRLRADLYYRINVVQLHVPPLRQRLEDVPRLARYFLRKKSAELRKRVEEISPAADAALLAHNWPGNARELENMIERAVVFASSDVIGPELLKPILSGAPYLSMNWDQARDMALRRFERGYLTAVLQVHRGSVSAAAQAMGVSRQAFYKALERTGINPDRFRRSPFVAARED